MIRYLEESKGRKGLLFVLPPLPPPPPSPQVAYHGFTALPNEVRKTVYNSGQFDPSFDEPDYAMVDTLFSLAEAYLFMQLVELKVWGERGGEGA